MPQTDNPLLLGTHTVEVVIAVGGRGEHAGVWVTDLSTNERFKASGKWYTWYEHYMKHDIADGVVVEVARPFNLHFTTDETESGDA